MSISSLTNLRGEQERRKIVFCKDLDTKYRRSQSVAILRDLPESRGAIHMILYDKHTIKVGR